MLVHAHGHCTGTWQPLRILNGVCCTDCRKWYPETPETVAHVQHEAELTVLLLSLTAEGERKRKDGA